MVAQSVQSQNTSSNHSHDFQHFSFPGRLFFSPTKRLNFFISQNSIYEWSRDHRVHHKYSETDADPHNATRGMFFSHVGWLLVKKHPDVMKKGKSVDFSDLDKDAIVSFQKR